MPTASVTGTFTAYFNDLDTVWPGGVSVDVKRFSFTDRGGCDEATLEVRGDAEQLVTLFALLGKEVRITNPAGDLVWFGLVNDVDVSYGAAGVAITATELALILGGVALNAKRRPRYTPPEPSSPK